MSHALFLGSVLALAVSACGASTTTAPNPNTGDDAADAAGPSGAGTDPVTNAPSGAPMSPDDRPSPSEAPPGPASGAGTQ